MLCTALLLLPAVVPGAQDYRITDLDTNASLSTGYPERLPDLGPAVGGGLPWGATWPQPVWWDAAGTHVLPLLPGDEGGAAMDANGQGIVVGESDDVIVTHLVLIYPHATIWQNGQALELAALVQAGDPMEPWAAVAVNEAGQVLGHGRPPGQTVSRAFLFEQGVLTDLGALPGGPGNATPAALNEQGEAVGSSDAAGGFRHAVAWRGSGIEDLHDPAVLLGRTSRANDLNERGQICGSGDFIGDLVDWETATLWDGGTIVDLGTLGGSESWAFGINDHGDIVGGSTNAAMQNVAFLWRDGVMVDLNTLIPPGTGWWLLDAQDIDELGRITGVGSLGGALRPYLLEPDCAGGFQVYGTGCAGAGGFVPRLWGEGCPAPGGEVSLAITNGYGGAGGVLLAGLGTGVRKLAPGCALQILPLTPFRQDITLQGAGAGAGWLQAAVPVAPGLAGTALHLQAILRDPSLPHGFTVTTPLQVDVR